MDLVVSDTSPLHYLARLELLHLLPALYGRVLLPPVVWLECLAAAPLHPETVQRLIAAREAGWLVETAPQQPGRTRPQTAGLDEGEREAIALAVEKGALLLMDEARGRRVAADLHLRVTGTIGVLLRAKTAGLIQLLAPVLERLRRETNYRMSAALEGQALHAAGELPF